MKQLKKSVLVTGAGGFIGSHLLPKLKKNFQIVVAPPSDKLDIRDRDKVLKLPKAQIVIHLAGVANVPLSWGDPGRVISINTIGAANILDYCVKNKASLIYPSSYSYGSPKYLPTDEKHPVKADNPYAVSKLAAESLCEAYYRKYDLNIAILRLFNVYGPGQSEEMVIPTMVLGLINKNYVEVQTGKPKRDMIFVSDAVEAFLLALKREGGLVIYNVGSGKSYSIKEMAIKLIEISGKKSKFIDRKLPRSNDILKTMADISKIQAELAWKPKVNIDEGLKKTYLWFLSHQRNSLRVTKISSFV